MWIFLLVALSGLFAVLHSDNGATEFPSPDTTTSTESLPYRQIVGPETTYSDSNSDSLSSDLECRYQGVVQIRELVELDEDPKIEKEKTGS